MPQAFHATLDAQVEAVPLRDRQRRGSPARSSFDIAGTCHRRSTWPRWTAPAAACWAGTTSTASRPSGPTAPSSVRTILDLAVERDRRHRHDRGRGRRVPVQHGPVDRRDAGAGRRRQAARVVGRARSSRPRAARRGRARPRRRRDLFLLIRVRYRRETRRGADDANRPRHHRLIIGGAQENTLLTVEGLHHRYRRRRDADHRPGGGPGRRPLRPGRTAGPEGRGDARAGPADPARGRLQGLPQAARGVPAARSPRWCTRTARRRASSGRAAAWHERVPADRPHDPRHAVRALRDAAARTGSISRSSGGRPGGATRSSASATP